ncbi:MAG TPA: phage antirepressor N-terminal domain-containing protein [Gemmataceae bacterium]|jgi:hypothetical protein
MSNELANVNFYGDTLLACEAADGTIRVAFGRLCRVMGLNYSKQLVKLRSRSWAKVETVSMMVNTGENRFQRMDVTAIDLRTLHGWLISINENTVHEDIRPKLVRYQAECVEVLERHFHPPVPYRPWAERFRESFAPHQRNVLSQFPHGAFTVITEGVMPMLMLEDELIRHMMAVGPGDRPCISIGLTYSHHRRKNLRLTDAMGEAPIWLPDRGIEVPVKVYSGAELHQFKTWLHFTYLPEKLQEYLDRKPEFRPYGALPRASVADNTCLTITGRPASLAVPLRQALRTCNGFAPASLPNSDKPQITS